MQSLHIGKLTNKWVFFSKITPLDYHNELKRGERSDTYLTHVCRLPQSIESLERMDKNWIFQPTLWHSLAIEVYCADRGH